jgi:hypothetical protein
MFVKEPGWKRSLRNIWRELEGYIKVDFKETIYEHMDRSSNQLFTLKNDTATG